MISEFRIDASWLPGAHGTNEVRATAALVEITAGGQVATRFEDGWSKSIQQSARVAAYPLALWLASSWWRLRWESLHFQAPPDISWRMAHEMPAAGYGYVWPLLTFVSDGDTVDVVARSSNPLSAEPVRYVADFQKTVRAQSFEAALDEFINLVVARLDALGVPGTHLHQLWDEVLTERSNPASSLSRMLEARLGFDPDEAPESILTTLIDLSSSAGSGAAQEIAPVCAGPHALETWNRIENFSQSRGLRAFTRNRVGRP